jgi:hypothetical protein
MENKDKIILDLCGGTGSWSKPYRDNGYTVINVTLPEYDVRKYNPPENVYGILAAPPCTEFSLAKSNSKYPRKMKEGMDIVYHCLRIIWEVQYKLPTPLAKRTNLNFWALENPFGLLRRFLGHPVLIFNPYDYGDPYQKKTCLWGYFNIPKKEPCKEYSKDFIHTIGPNGKINKKFDSLLTKEIHPEYYGKLNRQERRAITPQGFAKAFYEVNK